MAPATSAGRDTFPTGLTIDGQLGEWGALEADTVFALSERGLAIAGRVRGANHGVTIAFDFPAMDLPLLGSPLRGGGIAELNCETTWDYQPMAPDEREACLATLGVATSFAQIWTSEFHREWEVGTDASALVGGQAGFVAAGQDGVFELLLPLEALPMASESPIRGAAVFVRPKGQAKSELPAQAVTFGNGVSFGKRAALRKLALESWNANILEGAPAAGYRLGDDEHWVLAQRAAGWLSYQRREEPVLASLAVHNGATVGALFSGMRRLAAVAADGSILGFEPDFSGSVVETVKRGKNLHIFTYDSYRDELGGTVANWYVYIVDHEGSISPMALATPVSSWASVAKFHSRGMQTFGLVGSANGFAEGGTPGVRVSFRFSEAEGYVPTTSGLPE